MILTIPKTLKKEQKEESKKTAEGETVGEGVDVPVPPFTHVNNILRSLFLMSRCTSTTRKYKTLMDCMRRSLTFPTTSWAISEYKGVLQREGYDYEEFPDDIMEALLSHPIFTNGTKKLGKPNGFMLFGKIRVEFFSTSELLNPNLKVRLRLIRVIPDLYIFSHNPNVSLGIVHCLLYAGGTAFKDNYHKQMDMLAYTPMDFNYLGTLAKTFIIPATQNEFI